METFGNPWASMSGIMAFEQQQQQQRAQNRGLDISQGNLDLNRAELADRRQRADYAQHMNNLGILRAELSNLDPNSPEYKYLSAIYGAYADKVGMTSGINIPQGNVSFGDIPGAAATYKRTLADAA